MKRVHILLLASSLVYILEERLFSLASLTVDLVRKEHHSSSSTGSREWMATLKGIFRNGAIPSLLPSIPGVSWHENPGL
jgi:hypothetical protein